MMGRFFLYCLAGSLFTMAPAGCALEEAGDTLKASDTLQAGDTLQAAGPEDPVSYIRRSLEEYPIVVLGEGSHSALEPHLFLRRVLSDPSILRAVDVIIVEFVTALEQPVVDAYIGGDDVPFQALSGVWRNTSTSPIAPWDSPLYHELLQVIRQANSTLSPNQRVRVLAGDPPIDWGSIESGDDFRAAIQPRNPYVADVAIEQAFDQGKRVLIVYGGAHLPRVPVGTEDDLRNSLTYDILTRRPESVKAIGFLNPENLGIVERIGELEAGTIYPTSGHWVGELGAGTFFPQVYSRVTDPETGEASWEEIPLYTEYSVRDLFDGLVYIGPSSEWEVIPPFFDEERDRGYLAELNRRSLLRLGRPFNSGR